MARRHSQPKERLSQVLRTSFKLPQQLDITQPMVHINCRGGMEIENCDGVVEYGQEHICLKMGRHRVCVYGEQLTITTLNAHVTQIDGSIFRLDLSQEEP